LTILFLNVEVIFVLDVFQFSDSEILSIQAQYLPRVCLLFTGWNLEISVVGGCENGEVKKCVHVKKEHDVTMTFDASGDSLQAARTTLQPLVSCFVLAQV
jgi:hypothetical protein